MKKNKFTNTENIFAKSKIIKRQQIIISEIVNNNPEQFDKLNNYLLILEELKTNFQNKNYSEFMKEYKKLESDSKISEYEELIKQIYQKTYSLDEYKKLNSYYKREPEKIFWKDQWQIPFKVNKKIYILELKNYTEKEHTTKVPIHTIDIILKQYTGNEIEFNNQTFLINPFLDTYSIKLKQTNQQIPDKSMNTIYEINDIEIDNYEKDKGNINNSRSLIEKYVRKKILKKYTNFEINKKVTQKISEIVTLLFKDNNELASTYKRENIAHTSEQITVTQDNYFIRKIKSTG